MAMKLSSGGSRRGGRRSYSSMSDINVTPMVDVMLVLLIVFMVTAPLLSAGVPIDLPQSKAKQIQEEDSKPLEITIDSKGMIFVGETEVKRDRLVSLLTAMTKNDSERRIFIRGDQSLSYGAIMDVLGIVNSAGFRKVALISKPAPAK